MITVVAALIEDDNKILIAKRATGDPNLLGKWEFPGGKVETGENEKQAIEREMLEEFELVVKAKDFVVNNICEYPDKKVDLRLYRCIYKSGNFRLHDHLEYRFVSVFELMDYDLAPADIPLAKFLKENDLSIADFVVGNKYRNEEIRKAFKCSLFAGINRSLKTNTLVLTVKHNKPLYDDVWVGDIMHYSASGKNGDHKINHNQNKTLAESRTNGIKVYLFESYVDGEYYFDGEVKLIGDPYVCKRYGSDEKLRDVIIYPLKCVNGKRAVVSKDDIEYSEKIKAKAVNKLTADKIREKAKLINSNSDAKDIKTVYHVRNVYVSEYTKIRAKGVCDLCYEKAPFKDKLGRPYLEAHHVISLADGGPDGIYNTVALCPNCHRKVHLLKNKEDIGKLQSAVLRYLIEDGDDALIDMFERLFR